MSPFEIVYAAWHLYISSEAIVFPTEADRVSQDSETLRVCCVLATPVFTCVRLTDFHPAICLVL